MKHALVVVSTVSLHYFSTSLHLAADTKCVSGGDAAAAAAVGGAARRVLEEEGRIGIACYALIGLGADDFEHILLEQVIERVYMLLDEPPH